MRHADQDEDERRLRDVVQVDAPAADGQPPAHQVGHRATPVQRQVGDAADDADAAHHAQTGVQLPVQLVDHVLDADAADAADAGRRRQSEADGVRFHRVQPQ